MVKVTYDEMKEAVDSTESMSSAAVFLNMHYNTFLRKAKQLGLFKPNKGGKGRSKPWVAQDRKIPLREILDGQHPSYQTFKLKHRLFNEGIFSNTCSICGISEWNFKQISCELDHINGVSHDHTLQNLRILCPNCHSQTDTFRSKKRI
jgi:hypothetical protein